METYTVKAGDSLAKIALKIYGNANKWRELADLNGIVEPTKIKVGQVLKLMQKPVTTGITTSPTPAAPTPAAPAPVAKAISGDAEITISGKSVLYRFSNTTDKIFLGTLYKLGLSRLGGFQTEKFIENSRDALAALQLSNSEINTLVATSHNEGNLDAVNTWDSNFLSWGMFQWTLGQNADPGELPALLKLIKAKQPEAFKTFFGNFGIDIAATTGDITGLITLNGVLQNTIARKSAFRKNNWALRFALAGKDPLICSVQVLHAINRFNNFYFVPYTDFNGLTIHEILSSEYAASLLIDQHVNRPGHVKKVVLQALQQAGMSPHQLANGSDADELKVINKYLSIRLTFGGNGKMTDSDKRANVVKGFLDKGLISAKKRSFKSNRGLRQ